MNSTHGLPPEIVAPEQEWPPVLYKYVDADGCNKILHECSTKWSSPLAFNDPFDGQWDALLCLNEDDSLTAAHEVAQEAMHAAIDWGALTIHQRYMLQTARLRFHCGSSDDKANILKVVAQSLVGTNPHTRREVNARLRAAIDDVRVISMSSRPDSILMWSHYATKHKGAVIGFDTASITQQWSSRPLRVVYSDTIPLLSETRRVYRQVLGFAGSAFDLGIAHQLVATKYTDWSYECEWRFAKLRSPHTSQQVEIVSTAPASIREVILGCCSPPDVEMLATRFRKACPDVRVLRATRSDAKYALRLQEV